MFGGEFVSGFLGLGQRILSGEVKISREVCDQGSDVFIRVEVRMGGEINVVLFFLTIT